MITIYSKKGCQQCITAENLCRLRKLDHEVKKLDKDYKLEELQALTGKRSMSMPVIKNGDTVLTFAEFQQSLVR